MEFDVFLSHNSKDKPTVRALAQRLEARGIRVWMDEQQLIPGRNWQPLLEKGIEHSKTGAVLVGRDGSGPWEDEEMQVLLGQAVRSGKAVIPVLLPGMQEQPELPLFLRNRTWVDLRPGLTDEGLDKLVWGITGKRPDSGRVGLQTAAPEPEEPPDEYGAAVDAPLAKLLDHADQLAPIRALLADAAGDRAIALVEACSEDWPSYLADHIHLQPWPDLPGDRQEAVTLRLTRFDAAAFWQALIDELPRARHAAEQAGERLVVRDWINGARLRVLYVPVELERHGRHLPEIIRGAHATLAGLGAFAPGTRLLVLFACVRARAKPPFWWPFYARFKLTGLDCCRVVDGMRPLDKPDVDGWHAGFPRPLRTRYDRDRLKAELLGLFAPGEGGIRYERVRRLLVDEGALRRARIKI